MAVLLLTSGCVLAVEDRFTIEEPVAAIVLELGHGDVRVEPSSSGVVEVEAELAGLQGGEYGHQLVGDVLHLDYECGQVDLCGGDVTIRTPSAVDLDLTLGAGEIDVVGMTGDLAVQLGTGAVAAELLARPSAVAVIVGTGEIDLSVPAGRYALDLDAAAGSIDVSGITDDPDADATVVAVTAAGSIRLRGR